MAQSNANRKRKATIDENLKKIYDEAFEETVPDRFAELLQALKEQDSPGRPPK